MAGFQTRITDKLALFNIEVNLTKDSFCHVTTEECN